MSLRAPRRRAPIWRRRLFRHKVAAGALLLGGVATQVVPHVPEIYRPVLTIIGLVYATYTLQQHEREQRETARRRASGGERRSAPREVADGDS